MSTSINQESFLNGHESLPSRKMPNAGSDQDELAIMNNLNIRFVSFLNAVKSETIRCEQLKGNLIEQKRELVNKLDEKNLAYYETLKDSKMKLNDLCFNLSSFLVKERHNRILIDWYANMLKFEYENVTLKLKNYHSSDNKDNNRQSNGINEPIARTKIFSSSLNELNKAEINEEISCESPYLCNLSHISGSQSSLTSIISSSSSSCQSSSGCSGLGMSISHHSSTPIYSNNSTTTTSFTESSSSTSSFSLDIYLSNLNTTKIQLKLDFDKKTAEVQLLKQNLNNLNSDLNGLNSKLDNVKIENSVLNENVSNLRKQIEFYQKLRNFKTSTPSLSFECDHGSSVQPNSIDLETIKNDLRNEFEEFNKQQLDEYEDYLAQECLNELESLETEYNIQADIIDEQSSSILNDLEKLNKESEENLLEYEHLRNQNNQLNERLIMLSTSLCSFNSMTPDQQDILITNYSNLNLKRLIKTRNEEIKELKNEIEDVKSNYLKNFDNKTFILTSPLKEKSKNVSSSRTSKKIRSDESLSEKTSANAKLRAPYHVEIEYTKSNLFAYFVVKFDLLNSMNSINLNNKMTSNVNVNCFLKIVDDSVDGHSITIENGHKILDFDLSEWTIRREIYSNINNEFIKKNKLNLECCPSVNINSSNGDSDWKSVTNLSEENFTPSIEVIQYKFPKNFKLKRRKKVNLVASGVNGINNDNISQTKTKSSLSCNSLSEITTKISRSSSSNRFKLTGSSTSLTGISQYTGPSQITKSKCACCACKIMLTQKKGDVDSLEIKEVSTWGSGLFVITKFINSKNVPKLINIKCIKNIWVNSKQKEVSLDSLI